MQKFILLSVVLFAAFFVFAQEVTFPVPELGNCASEEECRTYCDAPENRSACVDFAEANGFMTAEEAAEVRSYLESAPEGEVQEAGPGGCNSEESCQAYCKDPAHVDECVSYGLSHGFITPEEAENIQEHVRAGRTFEEDFTGPGGCKGKEECRTYCDNDTHFDECISFAAEEGFMSAEEVELARKFHDKTGPGGCRGRECETYCEDPSRAEECLNFAIQEGLIPPEEAEKARKFLKVSQAGGPGGCHGAECRDYCDNPLHREECFSFAKSNDLLSEEELRDIEVGQKLEAKMKESGGPGGCADEMSCMQYCQDPAHFEECLGFATAHGGMDKGEAKRMLLEFTSGERHYGPGGPGEFGPSEIERFQRFEDFEKLEREFRGGEGGFGPGFNGPPGGQGFSPPGGLGVPSGPGGFPRGPGEFPGAGGFMGPGGCKTPQECMQYCLEHREECGLMGGPGFGGGGFPAPGEFPESGGEFPPPQEFPGHDEFPGEQGEFPPPQEFPGSGPFPYPSPSPQSPLDFPKPEMGICPLMPTVDSCPSGQKKVVVFESPECGTYYGCVSDATAPGTFESFEGMVPPENSPMPTMMPEYQNYQQPPEGASLFNVLSDILSLPFRFFFDFAK